MRLSLQAATPWHPQEHGLQLRLLVGPEMSRERAEHPPRQTLFRRQWARVQKGAHGLSPELTCPNSEHTAHMSAARDSSAPARSCVSQALPYILHQHLLDYSQLAPMLRQMRRLAAYLD